MKKKLIEVRNLDSFICKDNSTIYVDNSMLLTPGANDELRKRKIKISRVADAAAKIGARTNNEEQGRSDSSLRAKEQSDSCERLAMNIAVLLKEEYGITDLEQLKEYSFSIADAVKSQL